MGSLLGPEIEQGWKGMERQIEGERRGDERRRSSVGRKVRRKRDKMYSRGGRGWKGDAKGKKDRYGVRY